jgi:RNA-directed DNA polymerase
VLTGWVNREGNTVTAGMASPTIGSAWSETPGTRRRFLHENRKVSSPPMSLGAWAALGRREPHANDARSPGRSQHDALDALAVGLHRRKVGTMLANVHLHYVYDLRVQQWRNCQAHGDMIVIRYADDTIVGFQHEADARRFLDDLRERLATFELDLHPEKTHPIPFGRHAKADRLDAQTVGLGTFDFLGFAHICARSNGGRFLLKRQAMRKRMRAKLAELKEAMRRRLHQRIAEQGKWLKGVVTGYFAYHAVPTNTRSISAFRYHVIQMWLKSLRRRSQRHNLPWEWMNRIIDAWIPPAVVHHAWPNQRFDVNHPRHEPSALAAYARICAGRAG